VRAQREAGSADRANFQMLLRLLPNTAASALGVKMAAANSKRIILTMPITNAARQPKGLLHGGISMLLAEQAASMHACWGVDLNEKVPVGIEISGSHLRSAAEGHLKVVATVLRRAQSLAVHQVKIYHVETGKLLSVARVTNFYRVSSKMSLEQLLKA
jgi:1,4-dihydroxy-2-naphthoyl-CoA hydrolase